MCFITVYGNQEFRTSGPELAPRPRRQKTISIHSTARLPRAATKKSHGKMNVISVPSLRPIAGLSRGVRRSGVANATRTSAGAKTRAGVTTKAELRVNRSHGFGGRAVNMPLRAVGGEDGAEKKDTLSSLSSILGVDAEAEAAKQREEEERIEREVMAAKKEQAAAREEREKASEAKDVFKRAATPSASEDEDIRGPERAIAAICYLLPLLDGLKYSKFLLMQFPLFGLLLLPIKPAIDLWYSLGFLQIVVFFAMYLGVVNNQGFRYFTRFNAQQAILLDILLIVPDVLIRLISGLGGDDALLTGGPGLEAQVLLYNTVFLYVYLTSVAGAGASALGKTIKLPIVGDASEQQTRQ